MTTIIVDDRSWPELVKEHLILIGSQLPKTDPWHDPQNDRALGESTRDKRPVWRLITVDGRGRVYMWDQRNGGAVVADVAPGGNIVNLYVEGRLLEGHLLELFPPAFPPADDEGV